MKYLFPIIISIILLPSCGNEIKQQSVNDIIDSGNILKLRKKKKEIEEMITYAGDPKYLLYGTDWPISNMKSYLKFMDQLDLPDEKKELILWKNAAELFKIDVSTF